MIGLPLILSLFRGVNVQSSKMNVNGLLKPEHSSAQAARVYSCFAKWSVVVYCGLKGLKVPNS